MEEEREEEGERAGKEEGGVKRRGWNECKGGRKINTEVIMSSTLPPPIFPLRKTHI